MFEYIFCLTYFILLPTSFIYISFHFHFISVDIVNDNVSFQFSPEDEFTLPLYAHITLTTNTEAEYRALLNCHSVRTLKIQIALKCAIA